MNRKQGYGGNSLRVTLGSFILHGTVDQDFSTLTKASMRSSAWVMCFTE